MSPWQWLARSGVPAILAIVLMLTGCAGLGEPAAETVEIRRTGYGIPHIRAADWDGLGYGYGYAYAEDNICLLAHELTRVNGELARYFGVGAGERNLHSDFFYRFINTDARAEDILSRQRQELRDLLSGFAAGYNRYLTETGAAGLPAACRDGDWVRSITPQDLIKRYYALTLEAGSGALRGAMVAAVPPDPARPALPLPLRGPGLPALGSGAYALGRALTRDGHGLLLGNPHFPWTGGHRFYQVHLTIPGELDVMGASLAGVPLVNIGFNVDIAWTHTVSAAQRAVLYRLPLAADDPTVYFHDGRREAMRARRVEVELADGSRREHTFYTTRFGPVVASADTPWDEVAAFALLDPNRANFRFLEQYLQINRADSVAALRESLRSVLGLPWVNTLAVDAQGRAFYGDVTVTPNLPDAQRRLCAVAEVAGRVVLDGSRSECRLGVAEGAPQPAILGADELPVLLREDYVANSNNSYWLSNPRAPLTGFPRILGGENEPLRLRARIGLIQLEERLREAADAGQQGLDNEALRALLYENRNYAGELLAAEVAALCVEEELELDPAVDVCRLLARWDRRDGVESVGVSVFREFWRIARDIPGVFATPFTAADPLHTPRGLNVDDPLVRAELLRALHTAVERLRERSVPLDAPLGAVQFVERGGERFPIHGGPGWSGIFNVITPGEPVAGAGYSRIRHGSSYIQVVTMTPAGPEAYAVNVYSQSAHAESPHYSDQTRLYSAQRWVRLPFTDAEIEADPGFSMTRLHRQ